MKLGSITEDHAEDVSNACQPATFGLNNRDVLDEAYRKAGKLDAGRFAWLFNPSDYADFGTKLASGLFPWNSLDKGIRFRALQAQRLRYSHLSSLSLSLLTLFNKGRVLFFQRLIKIRLVTPTCSAPLSCFCLPPPLEANSYSDIAVASLHLMVVPYSRTQTTTSIAYITFFSDVEHEVSEVTSGHRVTITYNLYFDVTKGAPVTQYNCVHSRSN